MFSEPAIIANPELGLSESVHEGRVITDNREPGRGYPYIEPRENAPKDDANRLNHTIQMAGDDISNIILASLLDIPAYLLTRS